MSNVKKPNGVVSLCAIVMLATLAGCYSLRSMGTDATPGNFGPVYCQICALEYPLVDDRTVEVLAQQLASNNLHENDTVMVCNDTACVTYRLNRDGNWQGLKSEARTSPGGGSTIPGTGPTAGGPARDPRWGNIDCWTCTGTVTVGDPKKN